ncbi:MAG: sensor domain-containing diguanylate cyclase [Spirochaetia bacterium]|nr:sensor domain-containing diguanylate cyclase [Spirochaetia bacterium]
MKNTVKILLFFLFSGFLFPLLSREQTDRIVKLSEEDTVYPISSNLDFFRDRSQNLKLRDILTPEIQNQFKKTKFNPPIFSSTSDHIWFRLSVDEKSPEKLKYFYLDYYPAYDVEIYIPDRSGLYRSFRGGRSVSLHQQIVPGRHIIIPAQFSEGKSEVYIKIFHPGDTIPINLHLSDFTGITELITNNTAQIFLYIAVVLSFFIYNLMIFFVIREKAYLYYSLHIIFIGLTFAGIYGLLDGLPEIFGINSITTINEYSAHLAGIFSGLFAIEFLGMKKRSPFITRFSYAIIGIFTFNLIFTAFGWPHAQNIWFITVIVGSFVHLVFALRYSIQDPYCALYSVSWGLHLTILSLYIFAALGIADAGIRTNHIMLGSSYELFILSFALGFKFTRILKEKREIEIKVSQALQNADSLKKLSYRDPLTEIFNRRMFDESIESFIDDAEKGKKIFSLIFIDIDYFKNINDRFGHDIGDHVLVNFTVSVTGLIRKTDLFCRYGGEEFAIIAENAGSDEAEKLAEKIRHTVDKNIFIEQEENITISCGVTQYLTNDTTQSIIKRADKALYEAKRKGRNRVMKI